MCYLWAACFGRSYARCRSQSSDRHGTGIALQSLQPRTGSIPRRSPAFKKRSSISRKASGELAICDPFSITALALSAASSAAAYSAQQKQAQAQAKYQNTVAQQTGQIAQTNYLQQTGAAGQEIQQGSLQASSQIQTNQVRGLQAAGTANVAAAEGGVSGTNVNELLQDFRRQEAEAGNAIQTNQSFSAEQIRSQEAGLQAQAQGRIAGSRPAPVSGPSALALGLSLAGSGFSAYNQSMRLNKRGPYDPNANLNNSGAMFQPLPFLGGLLPAARGTTISS